MIKQFENYIKKCCTFDFAKTKSEEFYFGENNPLKTRLIANITHMREVTKEIYAKNRNAKPIDVINGLKSVVDELKQTIIEEFNLEGCNIGWWNDLNAACYPQIANAELYGKSEYANDLNKRLNDIVTTDSTGFHYKNKKGIYYCLLLGFNIFPVDNIFTVEEATAILTHELGHAMQQIVNSVNQNASLNQFQYLLTEIEPYLDQLSPSDRKYVMDFMCRYRKARKRNDKNELDTLGKELLEIMDPKNGLLFSKTSDDTLTDSTKSNWYKDDTKKFENRINNPRKHSIITKILGAIGSLFGAIFSPFLLLSMLNPSKTLNNKKDEIHACKLFEEAADNFCAIYGLGPQQASCMKKFENLKTSFRTAPQIFERIPLLDLWSSFKELSNDFNACMAGYPTNKQRALNLYKAADFEIKHNKDLTPEAKKELQNQIDQYKKIYEEFVNNDSSKGFFYKIFAGIKRDTIEEAAKKDNLVNEHVLIPLQQKADPKFNPDDITE